jgi:hypothetical protein
MAATKTKRAQQPARRPEKKIGPFHSGLGVAIWLNTVETEHGPRFFRSVTIASRRYKDAKDGQWKDAKSYRPVDLATLALALESAKLYCTSTPLPGQAVDGDEYEELHLENGEVPSEPAAP